MRLGMYVAAARDYIGRGEVRRLARLAVERYYFDHVSVVVRKDLTEERDAVKGPPDPPVRPASTADVLALVGSNDSDATDGDDLWERRLRRHFATTLGVEGCYVADAAGAGPAFMLYVFTARDNERLHSYFRGAYPSVAENEALLEYLYIAPGSRSPGFAVNCLKQVAEEARKGGASSAISLIEPTNKGALFVNQLAGFQADGVRRTKRRLWRRAYTFEPWPTDTSRSLTDVAGGKTSVS